MGICATTACNRAHTVIIRIIDLHILSVLAVSFQFLSLVLVSSPQRVSFVDCDVFCLICYMIIRDERAPQVAGNLADVAFTSIIAPSSANR